MSQCKDVDKMKDLKNHKTRINSCIKRRTGHLETMLEESIGIIVTCHLTIPEEENKERRTTNYNRKTNSTSVGSSRMANAYL